jgi:AAA domain
MRAHVFFQVLSTLKNLNKFNFPMAKYLISLDKEDKFPKFLMNTKVPGDQQNEDGELPDNIIVKQEVDHSSIKCDDEPMEVEIKGKNGEELSFKILEADTWPDAEQLGLDSSQYRALQAALTKELVVIQGPPGTGKTFMALKIAEILTRNKERMGRTTPILVVCLTNHALDQFLVGMMSFTEKIVRIGGQSKREELASMNLKNIAYKWRNEEQQSILREHRHKLANLNRQQDAVEQNLYAVEKGLVSKEGFVITGIELEDKVLLQHELVGEYLAWFLDTGYGYVTFQQLRADINDWKRGEVRNIYSDKTLTPAEVLGFELEVNQCAYYLLAELNFLESHFGSYEHNSVPAPSSSGRSRRRRTFQMSMDEKLSRYFQSLASARKVLASKRLELLEEVSKVSQLLEELRYMEQIKLLEDQDVIGLTTTGAARLHKMISTVGCQIGKIPS